MVCMHIGSGTKTPQTRPTPPTPWPPPSSSATALASMTDFLFSGLLHRFPGLKLLYAECQIGWIPYLLERARRRLGDPSRLERLTTLLPGAAVDVLLPTGLQLLLQGCGGRADARSGRVPNNVMFETDYPHQDGTWPHSRQAAAEQFGHLDDETVQARRGNAIRSLGLDLRAVSVDISG